MVLGEEVEFDEVADGGDDVLRLEVEAFVVGGGAGGDAVYDAGRGDRVGCGGGEAEEGGGSEGEGSEGNHFD